jgi:hypothetical protein
MSFFVRHLINFQPRFLFLSLIGVVVLTGATGHPTMCIADGMLQSSSPTRHELIYSVAWQAFRRKSHRSTSLFCSFHFCSHLQILRPHLPHDFTSILWLRSGNCRYPMDDYSGRGIVIVTGATNIQDAIVNIAMIRGFGCTLRIQVGVNLHQCIWFLKLLCFGQHVLICFLICHNKRVGWVITIWLIRSGT